MTRRRRFVALMAGIAVLTVLLAVAEGHGPPRESFFVAQDTAQQDR